MKLLRRLTGLALLGFSLPTGASLIGDTVTCTQTGPDAFVCAPPAAVVVDPSSEFFLGNAGNATIGFDINVGAFSIVLTALSDLDVDGTVLDFSSLDAGGSITGVSLSVGEGVTGLTRRDVTFDTDSIFLDLAGTSWFAQTSARLILEVEPTQQIPEPGTLGIVSLGLIALGIRRRQRAAR